MYTELTRFSELPAVGRLLARCVHISITGSIECEFGSWLLYCLCSIFDHRPSGSGFVSIFSCIHFVYTHSTRYDRRHDARALAVFMLACGRITVIMIGHHRTLGEAATRRCHRKCVVAVVVVSLLSQVYGNAKHSALEIHDTTNYSADEQKNNTHTVHLLHALLAYYRTHHRRNVR